MGPGGDVARHIYFLKLSPDKLNEQKGHLAASRLGRGRNPASCVPNNRDEQFLCVRSRCVSEDGRGKCFKEVRKSVVICSLDFRSLKSGV